MARRFRFRLETVRKLRERARDARRRAVADVVRSVVRAEDRAAQFDSQLRDAVDQTRGARPVGAITIASLRGHHLYVVWLHRMIAQAKQTLAERRAELERERASLAEAHKGLRVIENLRLRQWRRHQEEVAKEEQAGNDEVAAQQYLRRRQREHRAEIVA